MRKTINLLLVIIFSITTYNTPYFVETSINLLWWISFSGLVFGIISTLIPSSAQTIAKQFTKEILKKNGLYVGDDTFHTEIIKLKGSISNHQKFCSSESDSVLKTVKIFSYHRNHDRLEDLSCFAGSKRKTALYQDYRSPSSNWISGLNDCEGCEIFFVIWKIEKRKLTSYDINEKTADYKSTGSFYPKTIIEVYSR